VWVGEQFQSELSGFICESFAFQVPAPGFGSTDKTLKLYDHYHDLLNDIGKEEVMADIKGWIDARIH
jgi:hypothetical protein